MIEMLLAGAPKVGAWNAVPANGVNMPAVRVQPIAAGHGGKLYILGGAQGSTSFSTFWEFDPNAGTWKTLTATSYTFYFGSGCVGDGYFYTNGGKVFGTTANPVATTRRYNFGTSAWEDLAVCPRPLWLHASFFYNGKFYVWGGSNINGATAVSMIKDMMVYDPATNTWSTITAPATCPTARGQFSYALIGDYFYIMGGYAGAGFTDAWKYHIPTNTWTQLANIPLVNYSGFGFTIDGRLMFAGGGGHSGSTPNPSIYEYDFVNNTWGVFKAFAGANFNPGAAFVGTTLYVSGGTPTSSVGAGVATTKLLKQA